MRGWLFTVLLFVCVANATWAELLAADPAPPNITQQFISNYTLGNPAANSSFTGTIALDYKNGGAYLNLNGVSYIPVYLRTSFVATPSQESGTVTLYWFYDDVCINIGEVELSYLSLFPLAIPPGSIYGGTETIRDQVCSVWSFESQKYYANVTMWVNVKLSTMVRITLEYDGIDTTHWDFIDTVVGPFDPSTYNPPKGVYCDPLLERESPLQVLRTLLYLP